MQDVLESIDRGLVHHRGEIDKLLAAKAALRGLNGRTSTPEASPKPRRAPAKRSGAPTKGLGSQTVQEAAEKVRKARPKSKGRPQGGGKRADEALALVKEFGPIGIPALAEKMKIEPNYLYRVMPKLPGIKKNADKTWSVA